jgi:hypothetical protein
VTIVALGSARGAPGTTTIALLLAAAMSAVVLEADVSGGVLATRFGLGREPGVTTLLAEARTGGSPVDWRSHAQSAGGVAALVGPDSAEVARSLWERSGDRMAAVVAGLDTTVVADLGRMVDPVPLTGRIDVGIVVVAPRADHLVSATHRLVAMRRAARASGVVVAGDGPYRAAEVADSLGADLYGVVPADARAASMLDGTAGGGRAFGRTALARSGMALASSVSGALNGLRVSGASAP